MLTCFIQYHCRAQILWSRVFHPTPLADESVNYSCRWLYGAKTSIQEVISLNMQQVSIFKTFLLSIILRPWIYPLLMVTFPFKDRYMLHHHFKPIKSQMIQTSRQLKTFFPVTVYTFAATEVNVSIVLTF